MTAATKLIVRGHQRCEYAGPFVSNDTTYTGRRVVALGLLLRVPRGRKIDPSRDFSMVYEDGVVSPFRVNQGESCADAISRCDATNRANYGATSATF